MFELYADNPKIAAELEDVVRLFFPDGDGAPEKITHTCREDAVMTVIITIGEKKFVFEKAAENRDGEAYKREYKRFNKICLYDALSEHTGVKLPWGSLTGVRPTKLAYELVKGGASIDEAVRNLQSVYRVEKVKAELIGEILKAQRGIYTDSEELYNLYVHIPFCVSRCRYCSFVTEVPKGKSSRVEPYVEALVEEIRRTLSALCDGGKKILSVYVGGGTPTALDAKQLKRVLEAASCGDVEYTCEAGRPDTVTDEKLRIMADCGVNRVCVNPQTLCDETLKRIGRSHDSAQFFEAYRLARRYPFIINTDLIAGLDGETLDVFENTLDGTAALMPENITVHTLSRKNGAELRFEKLRHDAVVEKMVNGARERLARLGYVPYYVYRQKRMLGNLENTGYCKVGTQCVNNITTMEECVGVAACGAGAIGKRVFAAENRIERLANVRDVKLYLEQFEDRLEKKLKFLL